MKKRIRLFICTLSFLITINHAFSQATINVKGVIKSQDGTPLSGATISNKKGKAVTTSNQDGFFTIKVPDGATLVFSYIGYEPKEVIAAANMQISLTAQSSKLDEVEIVVDKGYA